MCGNVLSLNLKKHNRAENINHIKLMPKFHCVIDEIVWL
jgi:hypothetical protein